MISWPEEEPNEIHYKTSVKSMICSKGYPKLMFGEPFSPKIDLWVKRAKISENEENELHFDEIWWDGDF